MPALNSPKQGSVHGSWPQLCHLAFSESLCQRPAGIQEALLVHWAIAGQSPCCLGHHHLESWELQVKVLRVVIAKTCPKSTLHPQADEPHPGYQHLLAPYQSDRMVQGKGIQGSLPVATLLCRKTPSVLIGTARPWSPRAPTRPASCSPPPPPRVCSPVRKSFFILIQICLLALFPHWPSSALCSNIGRPW